jgi:hypothetical protein
VGEAAAGPGGVPSSWGQGLTPTTSTVVPDTGVRSGAPVLGTAVANPDTDRNRACTVVCHDGIPNSVTALLVEGSTRRLHHARG